MVQLYYQKEQDMVMQHMQALMSENNPKAQK
jgi:hypothetical protein